jgi:uncharacterized protein
MSDEFIKVSIKEFDPKKNLKGYTLIEGFPGLGLVGTIAAKYLIEKLGFQKFGCIESNIFIPVIRIRDGKPVHPSRIFINDKLKLVAIISEQIIPNKYMDDFARAVVGWVKAKGITRVIALSGIHTEDKNDKEEIYGIAANDASKEIIKKYNINSIDDGITSGITALILLEFKDSSVQAVSLLGTVKIATDYKAASAVLKKLNEVLNLNLDTKPLMAESKKVEAELSQFLQKLKKEKGKVDEFEEKPGEPRTYVA